MLPIFTLLFACSESTEKQDTIAEDISDLDKDSVAGMQCEENVCILSGTITEDVRLVEGINYLLRGGVFIGDDENETVLTIEPGVTVYGESSTDGMLVIRRGSKIMAEGTAEKPIVMTSSKSPGSRARGDWGGLIINGRAPLNSCGDDVVDCEAFGEGGTGYYGGSDAADSSGALSYVRVEFAGTLVSPDNELNGIAFQGVGSGTVAHHLQVHMNADDGIEFFGGTVDVSHVLVTGVGDDSLDWTDGWQGSAQYVVLHQHDDNGDNGIEADNNGEANAANPRSAPVLANFTIIGSPESNDSDVGILLREGTAARIFNTAIVGFNDSCFDIDHEETWKQVANGGIEVAGLYLSCENNFAVDEDDDMYNDLPESDEDHNPAPSECGGYTHDISCWTEDLYSGVSDFFADSNTTGEDGFSVVEPYALTAPDYTITSSVATVDPSTFDDRLETSDFIGAIGADDWTIGWTTHELN
ncbi:MAG: hypothetical protein VX278_19925 [Myxococcota bacterium]|nr:hypothetical protein [Myxococcota bacterium]